MERKKLKELKDYAPELLAMGCRKSNLYYFLDQGEENHVMLLIDGSVIFNGVCACLRNTPIPEAIKVFKQKALELGLWDGSTPEKTQYWTDRRWYYIESAGEYWFKNTAGDTICSVNYLTNIVEFPVFSHMGLGYEVKRSNIFDAYNLANEFLQKVLPYYEL